MGELASSWTLGFQGGRGDNETRGYLQGVITVKHYVANSLENTKIAENVTVDGQRYTANDTIGRHTVNVNVPSHQLQEYLTAFRAAARAGAKGEA